jgi:tRNA(His) 5'-end guanylyltransferase
MKKEELKKVLKPVIEECLKELIFEKGVLSSLISEVQGSSATVIKENKQNNAYQQKETEFIKKKSQEANNKLLEYKKKLIDSVGKAGYNGVNIFEGVQPIDEAPKENRAAPSAVEVLDPTNTGGINLNAIPGMNKWGSILKRVNEEKE